MAKDKQSHTHIQTTRSLVLPHTQTHAHVRTQPNARVAHLEHGLQIHVQGVVLEQRPVACADVAHKVVQLRQHHRKVGGRAVELQAPYLAGRPGMQPVPEHHLHGAEAQKQGLARTPLVDTQRAVGKQRTSGMHGKLHQGGAQARVCAGWHPVCKVAPTRTGASHKKPHAYTHTHTHMHIHAHTRTCTHLHTHTRTHTHAYTHTHTHTHAHTHAHTHLDPPRPGAPGGT